jgi:hypothetical protein
LPPRQLAVFEFIQQIVFMKTSKRMGDIKALC